MVVPDPEDEDSRVDEEGVDVMVGPEVEVEVDVSDVVLLEVAVMMLEGDIE